MNLIITTAAIIMSMCMNGSQIQENEFYYNTELENDQVTAKYVYKQVSIPYKHTTYKVLKPQRKYDYTYDATDRLATQVTYKWDGSNWYPESRLTYIYATDGYSVSYSVWSSDMQRFSAPIEKMVYTQQPDQSSIKICNYKLHGSKWIQTSNVMAPTTHDLS